MVRPESVDPLPAVVVLYLGPEQPMYGVAPAPRSEIEERRLLGRTETSSQRGLHVTQCVRRGVGGRDTRRSQPVIGRQTHVVLDHCLEEIDHVLYLFSIFSWYQTACLVLDAERNPGRSNGRQKCYSKSRAY